jgi:enoyl-CoA hydratase
MDRQYVLYEKDQEIAILTINRPEVRNALNLQVKQECLDTLREADADPEVRVVIVTGTGDKAFAAGADIGELQHRTAVSEILPQARVTRELAWQLENMSKPTIAAVNGYALGGGCEVALACSLRIASDTARFGLLEINLGIIPGNGGTQRLTHLVGRGRAMQMILTGEMVDAQEAYRIGLVNQVVPPDRLMEAAKELARKIASKPPLAVMLAKQAVNQALESGLSAGLEYESKLFALLCGTADKTEGVSAFLEKRPPQFRGE